MLLVGTTHTLDTDAGLVELMFLLKCSISNFKIHGWLLWFVFNSSIILNIRLTPYELFPQEKLSLELLELILKIINQKERLQANINRFLFLKLKTLVFTARGSYFLHRLYSFYLDIILLKFRISSPAWILIFLTSYGTNIGSALFPLMFF